MNLPLAAKATHEEPLCSTSHRPHRAFVHAIYGSAIATHIPCRDRPAFVCSKKHSFADPPLGDMEYVR
jgi:hypothetical protein